MDGPEEQYVPESAKDKILEVPEVITPEWINKALEAGWVEHKGKKLFVRQHDPSINETDWLVDNFGEIETGTPKGENYVYHAAPAELIPSYLDRGLYADPGSVNLSGLRSQQVNNSAKYEGGSAGYAAVITWKTPWSNLEYRGGYGEHYYTPTQKFSGSPEELPLELPAHLKNSDELRVLSPNEIIWIYTNKTT